MDIAFNILVIGFILLIAYWWFNQGFFSAFLHFVCVLCAGVLAFASWEPLASLLLSQSWAQPYAYGTALLLPFGIYLLLLRIAADKLAPDNLNFPQYVHVAGGGGFGLLAGVLTVGISLIGIGHTHSSLELMGIKGVTRTNRAKGQPQFDAPGLWVPAHTIAARTFGWLSEGSMSPSFSNATLASMRPELDAQALSLYRDTFEKNGRPARTTAAPGSIRINRAILVSDYLKPSGEPMRAFVVDLTLDVGATTESQGFALSASQFRLIGAANGLRTPVGYPFGWSQPNPNGGRDFYIFDDASNYVTGTPGATSIAVTVVFPADKFVQTPSHLMVQGLRLPFPAIAQESDAQDAMAMITGGQTQVAPPEIPSNVREIAASDLSMNDTITPASGNLNNIGSMSVKDDNYLFTGSHDFELGGFVGRGALSVRGIWSPPKTRIVRLNITRGNRNSIDLWNDRSKIRDQAGEGAELALVDDLGRSYYPIGFIHVQKAGDQRVSVTLSRDGEFRALDSFPNLSSAGADDMWALFTPPVDRTIVGIKLGDKWVARAKLKITAPS